MTGAEFDTYMDSLPAHHRKRVLAQIDNGGPDYLVPYQGQLAPTLTQLCARPATPTQAVVPLTWEPTSPVPKYRAVTSAVTYCARASKPALRASLRGAIWALRALTSAALRAHARLL